jgi:hypothetical protein
MAHVFLTIVFLGLALMFILYGPAFLRGCDAQSDAMACVFLCAGQEGTRPTPKCICEPYDGGTR